MLSNDLVSDVMEEHALHIWDTSAHELLGPLLDVDLLAVSHGLVYH